MNKNLKKILIGVTSVALIVGVFFAGYFCRYFTLDEDYRGIYDLITKYKKYYYFDDGDLVKDISDAILDNYSTYYTKEEYREVRNAARGNYNGIGVAVTGEPLKIVSVYGNSPAENVGIKAGGIITAIDVGSGYINANNKSDFTAILNSINDGKDLKIKIDYNGEIKEYNLKKQAYKRTYVHYYDESGYYGFNEIEGELGFNKISNTTLINDSSVGYIVYDSFNGTENNLSGSKKQFEEVLKKFKNDNRSNVIVDLRNNGGGYMSILSTVSSHFIDVEKGDKVPICIAVDKYGNKEIYKSEKCDYSDYNFSNIIILANENSASASEAFIGAVLDYDKNNIVKVLVSSSYKNGEKVYKTYGKGIMQNTYVNSDGSAVKLTTAEIFWPISNTSIHGVGAIGLEEGKILAVDSDKILDKALELVK